MEQSWASDALKDCVTDVDFGRALLSRPGAPTVPKKKWAKPPPSSTESLSTCAPHLFLLILSESRREDAGVGSLFIAQGCQLFKRLQSSSTESQRSRGNQQPLLIVQNMLISWLFNNHSAVRRTCCRLRGAARELSPCSSTCLAAPASAPSNLDHSRSLCLSSLCCCHTGRPLNCSLLCPKRAKNSSSLRCFTISRGLSLEWARSTSAARWCWLDAQLGAEGKEGAAAEAPLLL